MSIRKHCSRDFIDVGEFQLYRRLDVHEKVSTFVENHFSALAELTTQVGEARRLKERSAWRGGRYWPKKGQRARTRKKDFEIVIRFLDSPDFAKPNRKQLHLSRPPTTLLECAFRFFVPVFWRSEILFVSGFLFPLLIVFQDFVFLHT